MVNSSLLFIYRNNYQFYYSLKELIHEENNFPLWYMKGHCFYVSLLHILICFL